MCCLGRKGDKDVFQDEIEENGARHVLMMLFDGALLQKDCIFEGRINIRSKTGELKGWMKKNLLLPNRINVYDRYGNMKGFLVKDIPNPQSAIRNPKCDIPQSHIPNPTSFLLPFALLPPASSLPCEIRRLFHRGEALLKRSDRSP